MKRNVEDFVGHKYGKLTVIGPAADEHRGRKFYVRCRCECGSERDVRLYHLLHGNTKSCRLCTSNHLGGLSVKEPRLYRIWKGMRRRCWDKNQAAYPRYGGRGIDVCGEWAYDFPAFVAWARANGYEDDLSIDRIDNDKGYEPSNCRWVSKRQQSNNRRNTLRIEACGRRLPTGDWARLLGLKANVVANWALKGPEYATERVEARAMEVGIG